jgi:hypothetical protein
LVLLPCGARENPLTVSGRLSFAKLIRPLPCDLSGLPLPLAIRWTAIRAGAVTNQIKKQATQSSRDIVVRSFFSKRRNHDLIIVRLFCKRRKTKPDAIERPSNAMPIALMARVEKNLALPVGKSASLKKSNSVETLPLGFKLSRQIVN